MNRVDGGTWRSTLSLPNRNLMDGVWGRYVTLISTWSIHQFVSPRKSRTFGCQPLTKWQNERSFSLLFNFISSLLYCAHLSFTFNSFFCDAIASETVDQSSGMCWNQSKCAKFWADRDKAHFIWRQVIMKMCRPACNSRLWFQSGRCANLRSCSIWPSHFWTFLFKLKRKEKEKDNSLNQ